MVLEVQGDNEQKNPTGAILLNSSSAGSHLDTKAVVLAGSATASNLFHHTSIRSTAMHEDDAQVDLNNVHNNFAYEEGAFEKTSAKGNEGTESVPFAETDYGATASTFLKGLVMMTFRTTAPAIRLLLLCGYSVQNIDIGCFTSLLYSISFTSTSTSDMCST